MELGHSSESLSHAHMYTETECIFLFSHVILKCMCSGSTARAACVCSDPEGEAMWST